jgi:hypothetical protein
VGSESVYDQLKLSAKLQIELRAEKDKVEALNEALEEAQYLQQCYHQELTETK